MKKSVKITTIVFGLLITVSLVFYAGFKLGEHSEKSRRKAYAEIGELLTPKDCRESYGNSVRAWDCSSSGKGITKNRCALSLAVENKDPSDGVVFIDNLELKAKYSIEGLTQVWSLEDGSKFTVEPNGKAEYEKASDSRNNAFRALSQHYNCKSVNITKGSN